MKKRIISAVLAIILALVIITPAFAIVDPSKAFYIADYARVLNASTEQDIIDANAGLEKNCKGAQIVVVSVEYLDGLYADEYALRIMNDWGVGSASRDNGMVLLFATKENKGWLATGDGIDESFTDSVADHYLNKYFWKQYDKGNYDKAVRKLFSALVSWYEDYYNSTVPYGSSSVQQTTANNDDGSVGFFDVLIFVLIVLFVLIGIPVAKSYKRFRDYHLHNGIYPSKFRLRDIWSGKHHEWTYPYAGKGGKGHFGSGEHASLGDGMGGPDGYDGSYSGGYYGGGFSGGGGYHGGGGFSGGGGGMGHGGGGHSGGGGAGRR